MKNSLKVGILMALSVGYVAMVGCGGGGDSGGGDKQPQQPAVDCTKDPMNAQCTVDCSNPVYKAVPQCIPPAPMPSASPNP